MRRTTVYVPDEVQEEFKEICFREGVSVSQKTVDFWRRYIAVHKRGNPQTLLFASELSKRKCCWVGCERQSSPSELTKVKFASGLVGYVCGECLSYLQSKTSVIVKVYKRR